jgi:hypothetical protein
MKSRRGSIRNTKAIVLVSLFLLESLSIFMFTPTILAGMKAWPAELEINMPDGFSEKEITYKFNVSNDNSYDINVSARINNPSDHRLDESHTVITDLSWVKTKQDVYHIPAKKSTDIEVIIDIPDKEKPLHYNERWEVRLVISEIKDESSPGANILTELSLKLFIHTPEKEKMQMPQSLFPVFFVIIGLIAVAIFIFYIKQKKMHKKKKNRTK